MSIYSDFLQIKRGNNLYLNSDLEQLLSCVHEYNVRAVASHLDLMRCTELIAVKDLGSPATIHKNYSTLVRMNYLSTCRADDDKRVKYISLTSQGLDYLKELDKILKALLNGKLEKKKKS